MPTNSRRVTIQNALVSALQTITEIKTVQVLNNQDTSKYPRDLTVAELPAVKIYLADEGYDYKPALRSMNKLSFDMWLQVIEWNKLDTTTEEDLLRLVRNKLGNDITLGQVCVDISVSSIIKLVMDYPLIVYKFNAICKYEESISNL